MDRLAISPQQCSLQLCSASQEFLGSRQVDRPDLSFQLHGVVFYSTFDGVLIKRRPRESKEVQVAVV